MLGTIVTPEALLPIQEKVRFVDARPGREAYAASHLKGAVHADLEVHLSAPSKDPANGGRHPLPSLEDWARTVAAWGLTSDVPTIVYDDAGGGNAAARAWWMLRALGFSAVSVLDGGFRMAIARGLDSDDIAPVFTPAEVIELEDWAMPLANMRKVDTIRTDPSYALLDVRAAARFRGEHEPIDPAPGHIPGALNLPYTENLDEKGSFKTPDSLNAQYRRCFQRIPPHRTVVYCGSGVTACHTLLAMDHAGLPGAALYVGSWSEWCRSGLPQGKALSR